MKICLLSVDVQVHAPFLRALEEFRKRGISFILDREGGPADLALISHGLFQNKKEPDIETSAVVPGPSGPP